MVHEGGDIDRLPADLSSRVADDPAFWLERSTDHREKGFALVQKNSNFETRSVVSPDANGTVYALRGSKFYTNKFIDPS